MDSFRKRFFNRNLIVMMSRLLPVGIYMLVLAGCGQHTEHKKVDPEALFVHEVEPIFAAKCMSCHGNDPDKVEGDLFLDDYNNLLAGGESGQPAVVPGKPSKSLLVHAINRESEEYAMPPKDGDKLSELEVKIITQWIAGGAPWPTDEKRAEIAQDSTWSYGGRMKLATSGGLSEAWDNRKYQQEDLWAYYPLKSYEVPDNGIAHPIDAFLEEKRLEEGVEATGKASKRHLLRRATFDLTGLPPTPSEMQAFLEDTSEGSFEKVIGQLLDRPHYGEQWGRHWLDVVRYADTGGFSNDFSRPNAWRYRDYVVRSLNEDKPYDQFVREQIAGDELDPNNPENLIAVGFLRMGPWEHTSMSVAAETRQFFLDDVTNNMGEAFLATPLNCAKCHDHKYDPIPTRDYYSIQAVFATTQFAARKAEFLPEENVEVSDSEKERIVALIDAAREESEALRQKEEDAAKAWFQEKGLPYVSKWKRRKLPEDQQPPRYLGLTDQELGYRKVLSKKGQLLRRMVNRYKPYAFSVYNGPTRVRNSQQYLQMPDKIEGKAQPTFILGGGSVYAPQDTVYPNVMSILTTFNPTLKPLSDLPRTMAGRRSAFAQWLTSPENPLFARVMVNRVWQYHFGRGLADNANNFGATGGKPTHPALLDWLSHYFIENDWSLKKLHTLIMTSEAYQMADGHPNMKKVSEVDPDNELLTYFTPRRLEAEEMMDAMLAISGELVDKVGGFPVRPEMNKEAALQPRHTMGSIAPAYQPSRTPEKRNRRSIYAERYRTLANPDLEVFNQPGTDLSCERRSESTVTPQVFTLFNGKNVRDRALAFAHRLTQKHQTQTEQVAAAFEWIWCRPGNAEEVEKSLRYIEKMTQYHREIPPNDAVYPTKIKREMFEEMTGESFTYEEELDIYKNYVPDLQPSEVGAATRALADWIAVLFNSNEFVYVY